MFKVAIVDDNALVREEHIRIVNQLSICKVVGCFRNGIEIVAFCHTQKYLPDIILMDIEMPKFDGIQTTDYLHTYFPLIKIIAVSTHIEQNIVNDMFACGAKGYVFRNKLTKSFTTFEYILSDAVQNVINNNHYIDSRLQNAVSKPDIEVLYKERQSEKFLIKKQLLLTKVEQELLLFSGANLSYTELAKIQCKSPATIQKQVFQTTQKLKSDEGRFGLFMFGLRKRFLKMAQFMKPDI